MRVADLPLVGQFFDRAGLPTKQGAQLLRAVNEIKARTGGISGRLFEVQDLNGAGAVSLDTRITKWGTTDADAGTLADGEQGQEKIILMDADGGDGTLTPANFGNGSTITFNDVGDCVHLIFIGSDWWVVSNNGCTIA